MGHYFSTEKIETEEEILKKLKLLKEPEPEQVTEPIQIPLKKPIDLWNIKLNESLLFDEERTKRKRRKRKHKNRVKCIE